MPSSNGRVWSKMHGLDYPIIEKTISDKEKLIKRYKTKEIDQSQN